MAGWPSAYGCASSASMLLLRVVSVVNVARSAGDGVAPLPELDWLSKCIKGEVGENMVRRPEGFDGVAVASSAIGAPARIEECAEVGEEEWEGEESSSPYDERRRSQSGREVRSRLVTFCTAEDAFLTAAECAMPTGTAVLC